MKAVRRPIASKMTFIDRVVTYLNPTAGLRRIWARTALGGMSSGLGPRRIGAGTGGTMSNKTVVGRNKISAALERETLAKRSQDVAVNDPHAASLVDSLPVNTVGTGLVPQSMPNRSVLDISDEEARAFQRSAEWIWKRWERRCDIGQRMTFGQMQYVCFRSTVINGEFLVLPVMKQRPRAPLSLGLQLVDPLRLRDPLDRSMDDSVRDGVELGTAGEARAYWVADPSDGLIPDVSSANFRRIPAWRGHRPQILHSYFVRDPEQVRGESWLSPILKCFYDLGDYLDYELVGAIIAASFAVFVETGVDSDPLSFAEAAATPNDRHNGGVRRIEEIEPGGVYYGQTGQKPHILKNERPAQSFDGFLSRVLRAAGAAVGVPYEVLAKDFSRTNYSSARAALLEFWRAVVVWQGWLRDGLCRPVWDMVLEEAYLRGELQLPPSAPGFYEAMDAWCESTWLPPRRGHVDPVKEMEGLERQHHLGVASLSDIAAELGRDVEAVAEQIARERDYFKSRGLIYPSEESGRSAARDSKDDEVTQHA